MMPILVANCQGLVICCAVVANFYAPWCPWCQRLEPTYETVTQKVHEKYPEADGRIRFIKVGPAVLQIKDKT